MTYISGPITIRLNSYKMDFKKAENILKTLGHDVFNPIYLSDYLIKRYHLEGHEFEESNRFIFMKEDIKALLDCDTICMLPNWKESRGAKFEREVAIQCGIKVIELENL